MPLEGLFFFGVIMGWPSLAELYKKQGVFKDLCQSNNTNFTVNHSKWPFLRFLELRPISFCQKDLSKNVRKCDKNVKQNWPQVYEIHCILN